MSFSPDTSVLAPAPAGGRRLFHVAARLSRFTWVQLVVQCIGFASGILIVRCLEQHEYAFFTIANTMQATTNILADIGISIGLMSIGGRVWQDQRRFGQLISTGLKLRRKLGIASILVVTPLLYFMLEKNGASFFYTLLLIAAVLAGLSAQLSVEVFSVIPRLRSDLGQIQKVDFTASVSRLVVLGAFALLFLNAGVAALVGSGAFLLQYLMTRKYAAKIVDLHSEESPEDTRAMLGFIRSQAPNAVFFCLQGQITIFLITFFGHRVGVAEVGALGRLAVIFSILGNLVTNIFAPAFSRCRTRSQLGWLYSGIVGAVAGLSLLVLCGAYFLPNEFLFILGNRYSHLHHELLLIVGGATINMVAATLWALNASRAWIAGSWLYIPLTVATQLLLIPFTDFSSVNGVLTFNLFSVCPNLLLNLGLSYRGFRQPLVAA